MEINNAGDHEIPIRVSGGGTGNLMIDTSGPVPKVGGWRKLHGGESLEVDDFQDSRGTVEFQLPNGRKLVQAGDPRIKTISLFQDKDGNYQTRITYATASSAPPPKTAAGGRR